MTFIEALALFLLFTACVSFPLACLIGAIIRYGNEDDFDPQGRERVGLDPVDQYAAESARRVRRAQFRHTTRHGRTPA